MNTPICDFVRRYVEAQPLRLHMPGHKGSPLLGPEPYDITEIGGADSLYEASGIIRESEHNASRLFGCETYYSAEGSSLCIRAMLYLTRLYAQHTKKKPLIAAGRNAHKVFLSAAALLDFDVTWLYPNEDDSYLSCRPNAEALESLLLREHPAAVYLTTPDYLGNTADVEALARICHRHETLLLIDCAHGAYLRFLPESQHPMDLGADLCCTSAHKTLPVLTGGAYLHLSTQLPKGFSRQAKTALAFFGSTSPSYLILQSLDRVNPYLAQTYPERLAAFLPKVQRLKDRLTARGFSLQGDEPLKLTLASKSYGYTGSSLAELLSKQGIVCEFADPDFLVMMLTPETGEIGLERLEAALTSIPRSAPISQRPPIFRAPRRILSIREAAFSPCEVLPAAQSVGRVLTTANVGCPPAVPIVVCGEEIDPAALSCFAYYGVETCTVVAQKT